MLPLLPQVGSIAGNLMLKHQHLEFPSDIFLTLLGAGATMTLGTAADGTTMQVTLEEFLTTDMTGRIILFITLPQLSLNTQVNPRPETPLIFQLFVDLIDCLFCKCFLLSLQSVKATPLAFLAWPFFSCILSCLHRMKVRYLISFTRSFFAVALVQNHPSGRECPCLRQRSVQV